MCLLLWVLNETSVLNCLLGVPGGYQGCMLEVSVMVMMIQIILKKFPRKKNTRKVGVFLDPSEKTTQSLSFPSSSFWATTNSYKTSVVETTVSKRHLSLFCAPEKYTCPTQPFDFFDQGSELILITCARRSGRTVLLAAQRHWFWKI